MNAGIPPGPVGGGPSRQDAGVPGRGAMHFHGVIGLDLGRGRSPARIREEKVLRAPSSRRDIARIGVADRGGTQLPLHPRTASLPAELPADFRDGRAVQTAWQKDEVCRTALSAITAAETWHRCGRTGPGKQPAHVRTLQALS